MPRFAYIDTRLHASTKLVTLGGIGIFGGAAVAFSADGGTGSALPIAVSHFLTAPLAGPHYRRSGYLRGTRSYREETYIDEWGASGVSASPSEPEDAPSRAFVERRSVE